MSTHPTRLRAKARAASPIRQSATFPTEPEDSFIFGDGQNQSRITLDIPTLQRDSGIQFGVENEIVKGDGFRFDPAVQVRQSGRISHVLEVPLPIGDKTHRARAFGTSEMPNTLSENLEFGIFAVPPDPAGLELAITHDFNSGADPSPGDEAVVRASNNTLVGGRVQGPTSIIVGSRSGNATKVTLTATGVQTGGGQTSIDYEVRNEPVAGSGLGIGLDIGVFNGTTLVDPVPVHFRTSTAQKSGTITVNNELSHPCLRLMTLGKQSLTDDSPPIGWSCATPTDSGGGGGGGGGGGSGGAVAGGLLAGSTTLLVGGAAVLLLVLLAGTDGDQRQTRR